MLQVEAGRQLRLSKGSAVQSFPHSSLNKEIYGKAIVDYFAHNSDALSIDVLASASSFLSFNERSALEKLLQGSHLEPLAVEAPLDQALEWAVAKYFPQRTSQIEDGLSFEGDAMAASFADWILASYPRSEEHTSELQ